MTDGSRGSPEAQQPPLPEMHGRGLILVQSLADEWGVGETSDGVGKTVCRLRLQPTAPNASGRVQPRT